VVVGHQFSFAELFPLVVFGLYILATGLSVTMVILAVVSRFGQLVPQSKIFFGHIIGTYGKDYRKYTTDILAMRDADWIKDVSAQIVEVSQIALTKHRLVRRGAQFTFLAFMLWVLAFIALLTMQ
jgi:hypothetical protein